MLVLTREKGEIVVIGTGADAIRVKVCDFKGGRVRLGVEAPPHVEVHREEVVHAKAAAAGVGS